ncbi:MAG: hypothetical protein D6778_04740 [Nitrospirae bacterium]|nr:MAG: hypothetical protein D6778_04740 [Nitrospirota bacterium]
MKTIGVVEITGEQSARITVFSAQGDSLEKVSSQESLIDELNPLEGVNNYILVLDDRKVHLRFLDLPFTEEDKLKEVVPFELMEMTTFKPDEIVFSAVPTEDKGKVIVGFTEKSFLESLLNILQNRGIEVQRVTSLEFFKELLQAEGGPLGVDDKEETLKKELLDGRIDFLSGTIGYERKLLQFKGLINAILRLTLVVLLGTGAVIAVKWYPLKMQNRQLSALKKEIFLKVKPGSTTVAPIYQLKAEIKHLEEELQSLAYIDPLEDLTRLSKHWPQTLRAEQIDIKPEVIIVKGYAEGISEIETLKGQLEGAFSEAKVIESEKAGQLMRYTIEVKR